MKPISIYILLVNWNAIEDTRVCVSSLLSMNKNIFNVRIVVIDNGSENEEYKKIQKMSDHIQVIRSDTNIGYTGANNKGIQYALNNGADYVWLLNNDTLVDKNALSALIDTFDDPSVGIAGSKIYFMKGHEYHKKRYSKQETGKVLWYAGGRIDWNNVYGSHRGVDEVDIGQYESIEETPFVTGCSMMISAQCIHATGLLDNRYFAFLEDMDYCVRAIQSGYKVMYNPASRVWHKNAGSTGGAGNSIHEYYMTRNRILFGMRYATVRTKLALIKESFFLARFGNKIQRKAVIDAVFCKWGKR